MDDRTASLLEIRALLAGALHTVDDEIDDDSADMSEVQREILAAAVLVVRKLRARSRGDVLRWARAVQAGDEAWLVVHSLPGKRRAEAAYHPALDADSARGLLGR